MPSARRRSRVGGVGIASRLSRDARPRERVQWRMATFVIGDAVHGCPAELDELVALLGLLR